ncbi:hypothetical protein MMC14_006144 [Varicellaria rhodocarpa]|nr:hypothetical protein [Varicellaria rhodocarpa]
MTEQIQSLKMPALASCGEEHSTLELGKVPPPLLSSDEATLSPYQPPLTGLLSFLPVPLVPYAELMRIAKPAGYFAFYFPHLFGTLYGLAMVSPSMSRNHLLVVHVCFLAGSIFLRGAACTWNDFLDRDFDKRVARCQHRPLARGAITPDAALLFIAKQAIVGGLFFALLPSACYVPAAMLAASQVVYPFCKRFTNYPQLVLGFSLALGHLVGAAGVGLDWVGFLITTQSERSSKDDQALIGMGCLYLASVINTLIYDTIYGHQDLADDLKAGVKSIAVAWQHTTRRNCSLLASVEVFLLAVAGSVSGFEFWYFISAVLGTAGVFASMFVKVQLDKPESCGAWFQYLIGLTGCTLSVGLILEYWWK